MVVMGLSGSGKSTLIRHINRLIDPTAGEVLYDGVDVCKMNENDSSRVPPPQDGDGVPEIRASAASHDHRKHRLRPARSRAWPGPKARRRAQDWIERVGLKGFENHYPNQLSGGMQQRVGLARALTNDADILLMDEAYSALDPLIRVDMQTRSSRPAEGIEEDRRLHHPRSRRGAAARRQDRHPARRQGRAAGHAARKSC